MIRPNNGVKKVYLYSSPVDMRKNISELSVLVEAEMNLNLFEKSIFVFVNRGRTIIKILAWERNGFILWCKKLEQDVIVHLGPKF